MKNVWSVIFKNTVVDSNNNALSLIEELDEITVGIKDNKDLGLIKKISISFSIVHLWYDDQVNSDRTFTLLIEVISPDNQVVGKFSKDVVIEKGKKRLRTIINSAGITITSAGVYNIVTKYRIGKGKYVLASKLPLDVKFSLLK